MPIQILMPALSPTMETGTLAKWLKTEGEEIKSGDLIAEIETDKATMEIESADEGVLGKILVKEGTEQVPVNQVIAILLEEGEESEVSKLLPSEFENQSDIPDNQADEFNKTHLKKPITVSKKQFTEDAKHKKERVFCSPLARRIAKQHGLDISLIEGTGPRGRIVKHDVEKALERTETGTICQSGSPQDQQTPQALDRVSNIPHEPYLKDGSAHASRPLTSMRKIIGERLSEASREIPHFNLTAEINATKLFVILNELNEQLISEIEKITLNDLIIKSVARALLLNPKCNVCFSNNTIIEYDQVDISIAVALDDGLITPIIKDAAKKGVSSIASEARELIKKARQGHLKIEEFQGGTFTISNLGMHGVKSFNSIINKPQAGILSIGASEKKPIVQNDEIVIAQVISINLAVDHRCIDGVPAAKFLSDIKLTLENPSFMIL